jgi:hypothetical protein
MSAELDTFISILVFFVLILLVRLMLHDATRSEQETHHERASHDHSE